MPLTQRVTFTTALRKSSRLQVPLIIRQEFKLDTTETLHVTVSPTNSIGTREKFYTKMRKDGSITIPQTTLALLKKDIPNIENQIIEVTLEVV